MCGCFWRLICRELIWINAEEHSQKLSSLTRFSCHNRFVFFSAIFIFYALERGGKRRARKSICKRCGVNDAMLEAILSLPIKWKIVFNLSPKWNFSTIYILNFLLSHLQWPQRMWIWIYPWKMCFKLSENIYFRFIFISRSSWQDFIIIQYIFLNLSWNNIPFTIVCKISYISIMITSAITNYCEQVA